MKIFTSIINLILIIFVNDLEIRAEAECAKDFNLNSAVQEQMTATLKSASRLFADKNDLTSVIVVIPSGESVKVLDYDETFMHVTYENQEGYIMAKHATINKTEPSTNVIAQKSEDVSGNITGRQVQQRQQSQESRFSYLSNKYGPNVASRLYEGKIWKGMTAEMVKDSWGNPRKINRVISGNNIKEEWIYNNTWLFIQNNRLLEWGPVKK